MRLYEFDLIVKLFENTDFNVYMVGGTSRDFLLGKEVKDFDFVTDATPEDLIKFIPDLDLTFAKFGSCHIKINGKKIDLTTLREEGEYNDSRHPSYIKFVKDINIDYKRRDFTINAIYIDKNYRVIDPCGGEKDLENRILKMIGNPDVRLNEDPLRIIRAERFAKIYKLKIDDELNKSLEKNHSLIERLNPAKIDEEKRKLEKALKEY